MGIEPVLNRHGRPMYEVGGFPYDNVIKPDISAMYLRDDVESWFRQHNLDEHYDWLYEYDSRGAVKFLFREQSIACLFKLVWM